MTLLGHDGNRKLDSQKRVGMDGVTTFVTVYSSQPFFSGIPCPVCFSVAKDEQSFPSAVPPTTVFTLSTVQKQWNQLTMTETVSKKKPSLHKADLCLVFCHSDKKLTNIAM